MLFVNHKGQLCYTVIVMNKELFTMINVVPQFDVYDVAGKIINLNDWSYIN